MGVPFGTVFRQFLDRNRSLPRVLDAMEAFCP